MLTVAMIVSPMVLRADEPLSARLALESAEQQARHADREVHAAQSDLQQATEEARRAAEDYRLAADALMSAKSRLDNSAPLDVAQAGAASTLDRTRTAREAVSQAESQMIQLQQQADELRGEARKTFESSPAYVQIAQELNAAQNAFDAAHSNAMQRVNDDPRRAELERAIVRAEAAERDAIDRLEVDPQAVQLAGEALVAAQNSLWELRRDAVENDPQVQTTRAALDKILGERAALEARFAGDLTADPQLLAINRQIDEQRTALEPLIDAADHEAQQARVAQAQLAEMNHAFRSIGSEYDTRQMEFSLARDRARIAEERLSDAHRQFRDAQDYRQRADWNVNYAASAFREAAIDARREEQLRLQRERTQLRDNRDDLDRIRRQREEEFERRRLEQAAREQRDREAQSNDRQSRERAALQQQAEQRATDLRREAANAKAAEDQRRDNELRLQQKQQAEQIQRDAQQRQREAQQRTDAQQARDDALRQRTADQQRRDAESRQREADAAQRDRAVNSNDRGNRYR